MIRHASALMIAAALMTGPAVLLTALPAHAAPPTAAQLPKGTELYSSDGKQIGKVVDVLQGGETGNVLVVIATTTQLGERHVVIVPAFHFNVEDGKIVSKMSYASIAQMPIFDYSQMGAGH